MDVCVHLEIDICFSMNHRDSWISISDAGLKIVTHSVLSVITVNYSSAKH